MTSARTLSTAPTTSRFSARRPRSGFRLGARATVARTTAACAFAATALAACGDRPPAMTCRPWGTPEQLATRPSPYDSVTASIGSIDLKLCYSRPATRGRLVFGGLVPYDTLWRTGANEPTILHTTDPLEIAGIEVEGGEYAIYTVPGAAAWTVVVNASTTQWGLTQDAVGAGGNQFSNAYTEDVRRQEIGRAPIATTTVGFTERLTASFGQPTAFGVDLYVDWAAKRVVVPLRVPGDRR